MPQVTVKLNQSELYIIIRKEMEIKFGRTVKSMVFNTTNPTENRPSEFSSVEVSLGDELPKQHSQYDR